MYVQIDNIFRPIQNNSMLLHVHVIVYQTHKDLKLGNVLLNITSRMDSVSAKYAECNDVLGCYM